MISGINKGRVLAAVLCTIATTAALDSAAARGGPTWNGGHNRPYDGGQYGHRYSAQHGSYTYYSKHSGGYHRDRRTHVPSGGHYFEGYR